MRQSDVAGNTSLVGNLGPVVVDLSAPTAPTLSLANDTGADITDGITNDATVTVDGLDQRHLGVLHRRRHHMDHRNRHQLRAG
ncbi:hypothetical protein [Salinicola tamaricis]|uniref:hypothetical protein n=1 Tax=Salinicola tamaricis TaxID=1771309 RepID=UPI00101AD959|nr:hypothetical protein [Salinicola tamaricis]